MNCSIDNKLRILVVDDDIIQRMLITKTLARTEFDILEAENGREAVRILEECDGNSYPRIIVTDLLMPQMDGYDLISYIRHNELHYIYIIVLTSSDDPDTTIRCLSLGADDFIHKPVRTEELQLRLQSGLRVMRLENYQQMIASLAKLAEYRSNETGFHLERVERYTRLLGYDLSVNEPELGLSKLMADEIARVSPLHDIGKVAVNDSILHKPGPLTDEEFVEMKKHAEIGGKLLYEAHQSNSTPYTRLAYEITMFHHEKYDGSGYPRGLAGDNIPLAARIMAVADVYDAVTSDRCYKKAFSHEKAKNIIISGSGSHFDPRIVNSFIRVEDIWITVKDKFSN